MVRDGDVDTVATVMYHTVDGSATEASRDYVDIMKTPLVFGVGERDKTVRADTLQDATPETNEIFYIELFNAEGKITTLALVWLFCSLGVMAIDCRHPQFVAI